MTKTQDDIIQWHVKNGGSNKRLAGHALRLLNEAVELCVAAGANAAEIGARVATEIAKASECGEFDAPVVLDEVREELADVQLLGDVLAHYAGNIDTEYERRTKIKILVERKWEADDDGALWRPGKHYGEREKTPK